MHWKLRTEKSGKRYYSFVHWNPKLKKNVRLRKKDVPADITTNVQADEFCRIKGAEHEAAKMAIEKKLEWQKKYYDFERVLQDFEDDSKTRAPNSWRQSTYYLEQYAFDFFLNVKQCNNVNNWYLYFDEFREWLLKVKTSKATKTGGLAYSSRNHVIRALNTFLAFMTRKGKMAPCPKCRGFDSSLVNKRTLDDVLTECEVAYISTRLHELDFSGVAADFFLVSIGSGLRLSEGLALSLSDVFQGEPPDNTLKGALKRNAIACHGYVSINSQLRDSGAQRGPDGFVHRKPLKGRKRIDEESGRTIPIMDREVFNILASRFNEQNELRAKGIHGSNDSDYLLFPGLNKNSYSTLLRKAYLGSPYRHKSPHCARHTFATRFAGATSGDFYLCKAVLGHRDIETTNEYVHIFAALNRSARLKDQKREGMTLID